MCIITTIIDLENSLTFHNIINIIFTGAIGIGLLIENHNKSALKSELELEGGVPSSAVDVTPDEVTTSAEVSALGGEDEVDTGRVAEPQIIKCPKCSNHIRITNPARPLQISCPHCGVKGEIR